MGPKRRPIKRQGPEKPQLKVGNDAFALPIAKAGRLWPFRTTLFGRPFGRNLGGSAGFCFGAGAFSSFLHACRNFVGFAVLAHVT